MRTLLLIASGAVLAVAVGGLALVADRNGGRGLDALTGRDRLVAACAPVLAARLRDAGFEPREIELGAAPAGRMLRGSFTFRDGALGTRVDGIVACTVEGATVTLNFRTSGPPVRAG